MPLPGWMTKSMPIKLKAESRTHVKLMTNKNKKESEEKRENQRKKPCVKLVGRKSKLIIIFNIKANCGSGIRGRINYWKNEIKSNQIKEITEKRKSQSDKN